MSRNTSPFPPRPTHQETAQAVSDLERELRAAGLGALAPVLGGDDKESYVALRRIDAVTAVELARLLRKGMRGTYRIASDLQAALRAHGLEDFPVPHVRNAKIHLGDVSVATADRLALALGAPPQPDLPEVPDWPDAQQVFDRLDAAFKKATRGGFMDMHLHPYCQRCDRDPAVTLGELKAGTARRLVSALQYGA